MASLTLQIFCLITTGLLTVHGLSPTLATTPGGCLYHGQFYSVGSFQASPCEPCQCTSSGQAYCAIVDCFFGGCVDQVHDKNHCCPVCPNGKTLLLMLNLRTNGVPGYSISFFLQLVITFGSEHWKKIQCHVSILMVMANGNVYESKYPVVLRWFLKV